MQTEKEKAAKAAKAAYMRAWRAANREKVKQYDMTYWEKKAAQGAKNEQQSGQ